MSEFPAAFQDLPEHCFPVTLEALHPKTRAVVWSTTIEKPPTGQKAVVFIPPLRKQLGHAVLIRVRYADGTEEEADAPWLPN